MIGHGMTEDTLRAVEGLLDSGDSAASLDLLIRHFADRQDFNSLFEARRLKHRLEFGLPLLDNDVLPESPEARTAYESALIQSARETGELALEHGNIPAAWRFFRAIGDAAPVAAAMDRVQPDGDVEDLIAIALQEGVHPAKGLELVLARHGMCRAITAFGMVPMHKDRPQCIALLARSLHAELGERLAASIEAQEGARPATTRIGEMIAGRDWLFGEYDYYVDTSHLLSLLPYSLEVNDPAILALFHDICVYGKRLSPMFQSRGQFPFEQPFLDYEEYVLALLGDRADERVTHFRAKVQESIPEEHGTIAAQVLVSLLARLERYDEALAVSLAHLQDEDPAALACPSSLQLCVLAKDYGRFRELARSRGDLLSYVAASVMSRQVSTESGH